MADDFGLRIGIEGEKEFKSALSEINQAFKVLGSEIALVTSQFDKNDKSVEALTSRSTVLSKEIDHCFFRHPLGSRHSRLGLDRWCCNRRVGRRYRHRSGYRILHFSVL